MAANSEEERSAHRQKEHVADVAGGVRHRAGEDDDQREQAARGGVDDEPEDGAEQPAVLGDGQTEDADEDRAESGEVDEVGQHTEDETLQALGGEEVGDRDDLVGDGIGDGEAEAVADPRGEDDEHAEDDEERGGVREGVADALDAVEQALEPRGGGGRGHAGAEPVGWTGAEGKERAKVQKSRVTAASLARRAAKPGPRS